MSIVDDPSVRDISVVGHLLVCDMPLEGDVPASDIVTEGDVLVCDMPLEGDAPASDMPLEGDAPACDMVTEGDLPARDMPLVVWREESVVRPDFSSTVSMHDSNIGSAEVISLSFPMFIDNRDISVCRSIFCYSCRNGL